MKKISMLAIACFATIGGANAAMNQNGMGGFSGGEDVILTVEQVKGMNDNSKVWVEGAIIQKNGDEKYMFQDSTSSSRFRFTIRSLPSFLPIASAPFTNCCAILLGSSSLESSS
ncbi:MAG: NirD/YgiW/YdeI family stress tolerance protein, partial [Alphaproteobacteria bacterium]|nr:NirD/YgiW/YdeI family stress tolerance protein [Alphaproteobacteria bacterium]